MSISLKWQRIGLIALDAVLVTLALFTGYELRNNFAVPAEYTRQFLYALPFFIAVRLTLFASFNLYRGILRYASTGELLAIFFSATLGSAILSALNLVFPLLLPPIQGLPSGERVSLVVIIVEYLMTMLLTGGMRFSRRIVLHQFAKSPASGEMRRVLIVGAGDAGEAVARQMLNAVIRAYHPVAFVDDDPNKQNRRIHGIPVAGFVAQIPSLIEKYEAQEVLIAIPGLPPAKLSEIVALCEHAKVGFKILPSMQDVLSGRVSINQIRAVEIEDLLGREEITFDLPADRNYIRDEIVMITGAGGSIGSELCRQLLRFEPKRIVLLGHGENSIYEIASEINFNAPVEQVLPVIGDIRDTGKLASVIANHKPTIFFHAAAHKHVPLMEMHPDEAIKNNVTGTLNVARAAQAAGAKKFIMISSDKAVRPTNVMGASKRIAEMIVFCLAKTSNTQFAAVRFGNVLGSRGSVIPLFKRQIARGGPVTLTHPDVVRFFMTIPEAVSLVIQAGSMNEQRRLYLLDMGSPVKIVDLARNLIRLSGFEPDKDIPLRFTGMRPGEKLKEELLTAGENVKATGIGKIFITEPDHVDCDKLWKDVEELEQLARESSGDAIRAKLRQLVPDYMPAQN